MSENDYMYWHEYEDQRDTDAWISRWIHWLEVQR